VVPVMPYLVRSSFFIKKYLLAFAL